MAGLFLKMDVDLAECEEVVLLSELTGFPVKQILGELYLFWRWVERHGAALRGVTRLSQTVTLARVTGCDEPFVCSLIEVGWLAVRDGVFVIPNWEKRFSHTAKQRDANAERQKRYREKQSCGPRNGRVTPKRDGALRSSVTGALPDIEVDRDKEEEPPKGPPRGTFSKAFLVWWEAYPRKVGKQKAAQAWKRAGTRIVNDHDIDGTLAAERLLEAARAFAKSDLGRDPVYCPHPASWLNAGRYDDDRTTWDNAARTPAVLSNRSDLKSFLEDYSRDGK